MKRLMLVCAALLFSCALYAAPLNVWVKISPSTTEQGVVSGTTNLPDGTVLVLTISSAIQGNSFNWRCLAGDGSEAVVSHGSFSQSLTKGNACLNPGDRYIASATMKAAFLQPANVLAIIGKDGVNLGGPLVQDDGLGRGVNTSASVVVR